MKLRNVATVALAAMLLAPVATAYAPTSSAPAKGEPVQTAAAQGADGNYTRLYIEDGYRHDEVKPGDTVTYEITVGNGEDHEVELDPHVVLPKVQGRPVKKSWITIEDADTTLGPDEERTFTVTVSVPESAELGDYRAQIAFTNETISYEGRPAQPVHAATIGVNVFEEPAVRIHGDTYQYAQIQAGQSYTYEFVVENTGDEPVPLNPKLETESSRYGRSDDTVQRSWFEIEAPNEVAPGENATVTVTVSPPASADVGDYDAEINLGLKDPNRPDRDNYWQRVDVSFQVWKQPSQPFETSVQVSERADSMTLTLSAGEVRQSTTDAPVSFDVTFVAPNGSVVDHERVRVANRGHVSLGEEDPRIESQGPYSAGGENKQFTYRVDDPTAGDWTVRIMPHNTMHFQYEIVRNESAG